MNTVILVHNFKVNKLFLLQSVKKSLCLHFSKFRTLQVSEKNQFFNIPNLKIICIMQNNDNLIFTFFQSFSRYNDSINFKKKKINPKNQS